MIHSVHSSGGFAQPLNLHTADITPIAGALAAERARDDEVFARCFGQYLNTAALKAEMLHLLSRDPTPQACGPADAIGFVVELLYVPVPESTGPVCNLSIDKQLARFQAWVDEHIEMPGAIAKRGKNVEGKDAFLLFWPASTKARVQ